MTWSTVTRDGHEDRYIQLNFIPNRLLYSEIAAIETKSTYNQVNVQRFNSSNPSQNKKKGREFQVMTLTYWNKQAFIFLLCLVSLLVFYIYPSTIRKRGLEFVVASDQQLHLTYEQYIKHVKITQRNNSHSQTLSLNTCPKFTTLPKDSNNNHNAVPVCQIYPTTPKDCELAKKMHTFDERLHCQTHQRKEKICEYSKENTDSPNKRQDRLTFSCNIDTCLGDPVSVGTIDPGLGIFPPISNWPKFYTTQDLEKNVKLLIKTSRRKGFNYILLHCLPKNSTESVKQLLMFQAKKMKRTKSGTHLQKNININFLVLDSLSRPHFYRMLPETVFELEKAKKDRSLEVLDFQLVQSAAPYTIDNIRGLMSGNIMQEESEKPSYKFQKFLKLFKRRGYSTLFQEDACWYDYWGNIFDGSKRKKRLKVKSKKSVFKRHWKQFRTDTKNSFVDDYGLSHFSCEVFKLYGRSNQYGNKMPKVCFNDRPLSAYFLDYVKNSFIGLERRNEKKQSLFLSYTHLNTAHEHSGVRIKDSDNAISDLLSYAAKLNDTWTILLSDHGAKSSPYSHTKQGRLETYHPFLFMIIPQSVRIKFGEVYMKSLKENQNRLITFVDLHHALMSLIQSPQSKTKDNLGLFAPIPLNRTCNDIPIVSYALCICQNSYVEFPDNSTQFKSIAKYAVSSLNNIIDKQLTKSKTKGSRKCSRLQMNYFTGIRQTNLPLGGFLSTMYVHVNSRTPPEIFEVQVKKLKKKRQRAKLELVSWRRISIYQDFERCRDRTVDVKLCICHT